MEGHPPRNVESARIPAIGKVRIVPVNIPEKKIFFMLYIFHLKDIHQQSSTAC